MHLEPLPIKVLNNLAHTGDSESYTGTLALTVLDVGSRHFEVPQGIDYTVTLTNTGEAILLSGNAQARLHSSCDRCLEDAQLTLEGTVEGYYLLNNRPAATAEMDGDCEKVDNSGSIDIAPQLVAAIVVELPARVLCSPQCPGIDYRAF